jgi:hypothetical protein
LPLYGAQGGKKTQQERFTKAVKLLPSITPASNVASELLFSWPQVMRNISAQTRVKALILEL